MRRSRAPRIDLYQHMLELCSTMTRNPTPLSDSTHENPMKSSPTVFRTMSPCMKHAVIVYGQELPRFPRNLYGLLSSQEGVQYCAREFAKNQGRWFHAARIISYCV